LGTLTALRGTRDLISPEVERWQEIEDAARRVLTAACYAEIRTPVLERTELFERGVGEATDIVAKEMYTFESRSGERMTMRPENTAGVVRAFLERGLRTKFPSPLKLFYLGSMFRYERPQKGRFRQFHQLGVEILDCADPRSDAETILVACEFLREVGIADPIVDLNSLGDEADRDRFRGDLVKFLRSVADRLDPDSVARIERNPLRVFDSKVAATQKVLQGAPVILDYLGAEAAEHFAAVRAELDALGITYRLVPQLVRGLDYYTRTTFEIQSESLGAQSAVCGGGRYDDLVEELGGPSVPAVGWALGLERLAIILDEVRGQPELRGPRAFLVAQGDAAERAVLSIARDLRRSGVRCEVSFARAGFGKQFKAADRRRARFAVILGEDEMAKGVAAVKDLESGEQREVPRSELAAYLREGESNP
jgi:histidyl-tRNA synthetase